MDCLTNHVLISEIVNQLYFFFKKSRYVGIKTITKTRNGYHKRHERIGVELASHNWEMFPLLAPNGGHIGVQFTIMG